LRPAAKFSRKKREIRPAGRLIAATERLSSRFATLADWPTPEAAEALWQEHLAGVSAVQPALPALAAAAEAAAVRLQGKGRLVYVGAGTSGRLCALDGAELAPTFGWPAARLLVLLAGGTKALVAAVENAEDDHAAAEAAVAAHALAAADVMIAVAASGATPFTVAAVTAAAGRGALTISIANSESTPLLAVSDHPILLATGPEAIVGSTRMKAGTAQKVALTLLSTLLMLRLGHVWRGLMIDMHATNAKLRDRAVRMLCARTGAGEAEVTTAITAAGGQLKLAVLLLAGLDRADAEAALRLAGGNLDRALAGRQQ
jgi:N-acetylmuramic acid 6-phosphate etherase